LIKYLKIQQSMYAVHAGGTGGCVRVREYVMQRVEHSHRTVYMYGCVYKCFVFTVTSLHSIYIKGFIN